MGSVEGIRPTLSMAIPSCRPATLTNKVADGGVVAQRFRHITCHLPTGKVPCYPG